jgi:CelD/BcsL family acetyltransferase involved in cellulose biosynthesis
MNEAGSISFEPLRGWRAAETQLAEWEQLARAAGSWLPFQEPGWSRAWWRHWAARGSLRADRFLLWVGRDEGERVRALLPTVLSTHPGRGPLRLRVLGALGRDPNLTELQPLLCRAEDVRAAHAGLLRALYAHRREWDAFRWASVPSPAAAIVRATPGVERVRSLPDYVLHTGESWPGFAATLPRNVKEAMRKARNAPRRAGLQLRFRVLDDAAEIGRLLPEFVQLHARRSQAPAAPPHPDVFGNGPATAFLADLLAAWSRAGIARALALFDDGRLIACRLAFRMRDTLYLYYSGYDPDYARYSVMTRTMVDGIRWAVENGVRVVNLSTGTDVAKTRWRPACVEYETLWQWAPSLRGRCARLLHRLAGHDRRG